MPQKDSPRASKGEISAITFDKVTLFYLDCRATYGNFSSVEMTSLGLLCVKNVIDKPNNTACVSLQKSEISPLSPDRSGNPFVLGFGTKD